MTTIAADDEEEPKKAEADNDHTVPVETPEPQPDNLVLRKLLVNYSPLILIVQIWFVLTIDF